MFVQWSTQKKSLVLFVCCFFSIHFIVVSFFSVHVSTIFTLVLFIFENYFDSETCGRLRFCCCCCWLVLNQFILFSPNTSNWIRCNTRNNFNGMFILPDKKAILSHEAGRKLFQIIFMVKCIARMGKRENDNQKKLQLELKLPNKSSYCLFAYQRNTLISSWMHNTMFVVNLHLSTMQTLKLFSPFPFDLQIQNNKVFQDLCMLSAALLNGNILQKYKI